MSNFWGEFFYVLGGKNIFLKKNIVASALKCCIKWSSKKFFWYREPCILWLQISWSPLFRDLVSCTNYGNSLQFCDLKQKTNKKFSKQKSNFFSKKIFIFILFPYIFISWILSGTTYHEIQEPSYHLFLPPGFTSCSYHQALPPDLTNWSYKLVLPSCLTTWPYKLVV